LLDLDWDLDFGSKDSRGLELGLESYGLGLGFRLGGSAASHFSSPFCAYKTDSTVTE